MVERALNILSLRAKAIASNIANTNTPNYKRIDVPFFSAMRLLLSNDDIAWGCNLYSLTHQLHEA